MKRLRIDAATFDGEKFARRYGLRLEEFHAARDGAGLLWLHYPDALPDDPVLESPDDAPVYPTASVEKVLRGEATLTEVQAVLKYFLQTRLKGS